MSNRIDYAKTSPAGYKAFGGVHVYVQNCGLSHELIDLIYLRVSQINGCAYCIDMHSRDLLKLGVTVDKLVLVPVWRDAGEVFSARERAALAWAESRTGNYALKLHRSRCLTARCWSRSTMPGIIWPRRPFQMTTANNRYWRRPSKR
jgi:AhpD family alkylhydroperoxidase